MVLASGGNVGIGTTAPSAKLQVNGGVKLGSLATGTCNASTAGTMQYVAGASGVADQLSMCLKSSANTYSWKVVVTG